MLHLPGARRSAGPRSRSPRCPGGRGNRLRIRNDRPWLEAQARPPWENCPDFDSRPDSSDTPRPSASRGQDENLSGPSSTRAYIFPRTAQSVIRRSNGASCETVQCGAPAPSLGSRPQHIHRPRRTTRQCVGIRARSARGSMRGWGEVRWADSSNRGWHQIQIVLSTPSRVRILRFDGFQRELRLHSGSPESFRYRQESHRRLGVSSHRRDGRVGWRKRQWFGPIHQPCRIPGF
jgi:hypothetical protein